MGIAFRVAAEFRRRASTTREVSGAEIDPVSEAAGPDSTLEHRERRASIDQALASLSEERRAVFIMHELEGLTANEISDAMGVPLQTTYSRLRTGRQEFSDAVKRIRLKERES